MSAASTTPLWGQAWELIVTYATASGASTATIKSTTWEPEALRITFDVLQAMNSEPLWFADIAVYNTNDPTTQNLLLNASWVELKAGFQTTPGYYATIWNGPVFQTIFTREDVVDQKITLHCVANPIVMDQIISFATGPAPFNQSQLMSRMAKQIGMPDVSSSQGTLGQIAAARTTAVQYPRGNTCFGKVSKYFGQIAAGHGLQTFHDGIQTYMSEIDTGSRTPDLIYSPQFPPGSAGVTPTLPSGTTQSLIDTPQQIQQGVIFRTLLDPRLKIGLPPLVVQLVQTQVALLVRQPNPNGALPTALTPDLMFFVGQVRHTGDTRGNTWQTEVTGWSTTYAQTMLSLFAGAGG